MIGGAGEKKTLRLVAKYGDATNLFAHPDTGPDPVRAKLDVLAAHCEREGTDYDQIRKTVLWAGPVATDADSAKRFTDQLAAYARIGIEEVHVMPWTGDPVGFIEGLGEHAIGQIAEL
jgi:alkanesulfonate monooxygenase SsuD/methylene tetrahydromethanopterin reductase-like flavin-dependent oxidoreductase (luciferase family)